jgi:hypothetical protein
MAGHRSGTRIYQQKCGPIKYVCLLLKEQRIIFLFLISFFTWSLCRRQLRLISVNHFAFRYVRNRFTKVSAEGHRNYKGLLYVVITSSLLQLSPNILNINFVFTCPNERLHFIVIPCFMCNLTLVTSESR